MIVPESAGNDHRPVVRVLLLVAEYVGDDVEPLDAPDGVLHEYPDAAFATILFFESLAQWSSFGLFDGYRHGVAGEFLKESLKPRIHPDPYIFGNVVREPRPLHDAEIVLLAFGGGAQIPHPPPPGGQDDVLAGMALLLAGIVGGLPALVLRPLDGALGAVEEYLLGLGERLKELLNRLDLPFRQGKFLPHGRFQDRGQMVGCAPDVAAVAVVEEAERVEGGIHLVVQKNEEELVLHRDGEELPACAWLARPGGISEVLLRRPLLQGGGEHREEAHELLRGEAGEGAAEPVPFKDFFNGHHIGFCSIVLHSFVL